MTIRLRLTEICSRLSTIAHHDSRGACADRGAGRRSPMKKRASSMPPAIFRDATAARLFSLAATLPAYYT